MADTDDSREKQRAYQREYMREWRAANPEETRESWRKSREKRKEDRRRYAYNAHKRGARQRGIEFLLTFDEWCAIWDASGKWEQRGAHVGEYCMARHGDIGPYATHNVRICTTDVNRQESHTLRRGRPVSAKRLAALELARKSRWAKYRAAREKE
jgi:hypothetical protein